MAVSWVGCLRRFAVVLALAAAPAGATVADWGPPGAPRLILEHELDRAQTYVHAQAVFTLRFYQAIDVRELELSAPATPLAELRQIGEARIDEATRGGQRYRVTERRYAVFPFASGELVLSGAHASGLVAVAGAAPGARVAVRLDAPPLRLDVVPAPDAAGTEAWLPARALTLTEHWHTDPQAARVGEALVRTVRIEATGVSAAQLPAPDPGGDGYAAYPAPPRLEDRFDHDLNIGVRTQDWRIVPARAGRVEIAEVRLPWWDARTGERRIARIPARTLTVAPAREAVADAGAQATAVSSVAPGAAAPAVAPVERGAEAGPAVQPAPSARGASPWYWMTWGVLLGVIALAWRAARRPHRVALRALRRACRRNDARAARNALLAWAATAAGGGRVRTLGELASRLSNPALRAAVAELDRHLYGPVAQDWNGRGLNTLRGVPPAAD